ncbi:MAG TPA: hydrogenase maturation protease [Bryobacteraceae bacterium]|nr:hydrogenase maturation protease [Bryobacteraceae bacterium]
MLIIGLGNPDRGDDAAGLLVARRLVERGIQAIEHVGGTLDLIEILRTADCALVVDAVVSGAVPGTLHMWDAQRADLRSRVFRSSTHALNLADAIELARVLHRLPNQLTVYGIEAAHFVVGTPPSAQVLVGVERTVEHILSHMASSSCDLGACSFPPKRFPA